VVCGGDNDERSCDLIIANYGAPLHVRISVVPISQRYTQAYAVKQYRTNAIARTSVSISSFLSSRARPSILVTLPLHSDPERK
jgi:hypothetical protein